MPHLTLPYLITNGTTDEAHRDIALETMAASGMMSLALPARFGLSWAANGHGR